MTSFLLPCGCGVDIPVTSSQAGGLATCPACGREEPVPRLRDLGKLRAAAAPRGKGDVGASRSWTGMHTLVLAGSLLAATGGLLSLSFTPPEVEMFDDATIRSSAMRAPTDEVYSAWVTRLVHASVDRPPTEMEAKSKARSDYYHTLRNGLRAAAAVGALAALAGGLGVLFSARKVDGR